MQTTHPFSKILELNERVKTEKEKVYVEHVNKFEKIAKELYEVLKEKEETEKRYKKAILKETRVDYIQNQSRHLFGLERKILSIQKEYKKARSKMEDKQEELQDAYIEVKKIENLLEKFAEEKRNEELRLERTTMDEISIQQFIRNQAR